METGFRMERGVQEAEIVRKTEAKGGPCTARALLGHERHTRERPSHQGSF